MWPIYSIYCQRAGLLMCVSVCVGVRVCVALKRASSQVPQKKAKAALKATLKFYSRTVCQENILISKFLRINLQKYIYFLYTCLCFLKQVKRRRRIMFIDFTK